MKLTGNETALVTVYDDAEDYEDTEDEMYDYAEDLYEEVRKRVYNTLVRGGCLPFLHNPFGCSGFILTPRGNGGAVGVYYRHLEHVSIQEFVSFRDERLDYYKTLLSAIKDGIVKEIPMIDDGIPGWHVEFFDKTEE